MDPSSLRTTSKLLGLPPKGPLDQVSAHLQLPVSGLPWACAVPLSSPTHWAACCALARSACRPSSLPHFFIGPLVTQTSSPLERHPRALPGWRVSWCLPCVQCSLLLEHQALNLYMVPGPPSPQDRELLSAGALFAPLCSPPVTWVVLNKCLLNGWTSLNQEGGYSTHLFFFFFIAKPGKQKMMDALLFQGCSRSSMNTVHVFIQSHLKRHTDSCRPVSQFRRAIQSPDEVAYSLWGNGWHLTPPDS